MRSRDNEGDSMRNSPAHATHLVVTPFFYVFIWLVFYSHCTISSASCPSYTLAALDVCLLLHPLAALPYVYWWCRDGPKLISPFFLSFPFPFFFRSFSPSTGRSDWWMFFRNSHVVLRPWCRLFITTWISFSLFSLFFLSPPPSPANVFFSLILLFLMGQEQGEKTLKKTWKKKRESASYIDIPKPHWRPSHSGSGPGWLGIPRTIVVFCFLRPCELLNNVDVTFWPPPPPAFSTCRDRRNTQLVV